MVERMTCAKMFSGGDNVCSAVEGDEESPPSNGNMCAPNGPSSDSTVPSVATQADGEEDLRDFHLVLTTKNKSMGEQCIRESAEENDMERSVADTRITNKVNRKPSAAPSHVNMISTTVSTIESNSAPMPSVTFYEAGMYMNYCMTMCCLEQYGVSTTKDSIFHSKDIPAISVRQYMERFFAHPCISPSGMLAGLLLIFRFSFLRFPVDIYSVHRFILTGASVGTKLQDDIHQGVPYLCALGGIPAGELITLQNTFCEVLDWNLYFHTEDYRELLDVMHQLLAEPAEGELNRFSVEHREEIEAFNIKRLRVTVGMQWFHNDCAGNASSPDGTSVEVQDENLERLKAVFALNRWNRIMKPWLERLKKRCDIRSETIQKVMEHDLQECVKSPNSRLASAHQCYAWDQPSSMAYQLNTNTIQQHQARFGQGYSRFTDPRNGLYASVDNTSNPLHIHSAAVGGFGSSTSMVQPAVAAAAAPFGSTANAFGIRAGEQSMSTRLGGFSDAKRSFKPSNFFSRVVEGGQQPPQQPPQGSRSAEHGTSAPSMNKLTYAPPYVRKGANTTTSLSANAGGAEGTTGQHKRIIGHKRSMPTTFTDGYVQ